jgi:transposase
MKETTFMNVNEVAKELQTSKAFAYKVIREMNEELAKQNYLVIAGKIPRKFFQERCYGMAK